MSTRSRSDNEIAVSMLDLRVVPHGHIDLGDPESDELACEQEAEVGEDPFWLGRCHIGLPPEYMNRAVVNQPKVCTPFAHTYRNTNFKNYI
jgi:hypothetical protein